MQGRLTASVMMVVLCAVAVHAQDKPAAPASVVPQDAGAKAADVKAAPTMTEIQKLTFLNLAKDIELAQLKAQAAQAAFTRAQAEIQQLIASLQVEGYTLDLQTLAYTKKSPEPAKAPAKPKGGGL